MTRVIRVRSGTGDGPRPNTSAEPVLLPGEPGIAQMRADDAVAVLLAQPSSPLTRALDRLVRLVEGRVVGLALGSGAAFGLAHIGVLQALEEARVPVDLIAGSSMGAVIGAGYASGASPDELEKIANANSSLRQLVATLDLALTGDGLLAGRRLLDYLRPFFAAAPSFEDLVVPLRAVSTDLATGERVAIASGSVERAIRASIAMPPFVAPVVEGARTLVDGGIADPVPCDVVRSMGADIVVGVNVVPLPDPDSITVLTQVSRGLNRLNPFARLNRGVDRMNVLDLLMNSFQVGQHHLAAAAGGADVWIRPELDSFTWIDFYRAPEMIRKGHEAGAAAADEVHRCLESRVSNFMSRAKASVPV